MGSNSFGTLFQITTWGESHGKAVGVVIDGCPPNLPLCEEEVTEELQRRAPGRSPLSSPRKEPDRAEIFSGVFEGKTTGAPISIVIFNKDADSSKYEPIKDQLRPGHATYTYHQKYGIFDYRGGGRASARETVCRVAAGVVARKVIEKEEIRIRSKVVEVGGVSDNFEKVILAAKEVGDSLGGVIEIEVKGVPVGLGEPIYQKMEALLALAMLSLPAAKGFEIGEGFAAAAMRGSEHNDLFVMEEEEVRTETNHAGGTLAGITTGMPLVFRVPFKPTASVKRAQKSLTIGGDRCLFELPEGSRHDPCVIFRAQPIVEAMTALVLADTLLLKNASTSSS
ncbi:MAG: Chorismate synthase [Chlamydiales bacterium]|nr:Chorismate synthase [Chlamydiales bacterium]MCH9620012.1 Chorismate synthase [Chlamydiales bacterium]MCH9622884.1 Chorismate synthase [Chlamydiales bacterium]